MNTNIDISSLLAYKINNFCRKEVNKRTASKELVKTSLVKSGASLPATLDEETALKYIYLYISHLMS